MRCACFWLVNSGDCLPSAESQTHRIHSDGMMTFGPNSTAQRKPSTPDTSIAFSRPSSESRNASSSSISWLVSPIRSRSPALSSNEKLRPTRPLPNVQNVDLRLFRLLSRLLMVRTSSFLSLRSEEHTSELQSHQY